MKKIMIFTLLLTPMIFPFGGNSIKQEYELEQNNRITEVEVPEIITEDFAVATTEETENDMSWTFNLDPIINAMGDTYVTSIHFYDQDVNFRYSIEWKEMGTLSVPFYNEYYFYTNEGPGDANGHDGYNEAELDGHTGGVHFNETTLDFGHTQVLTTGYSVSHYDEYMDDGYGFEDNGSGYYWEPYEITASFIADDTLGIDYALKIDWNWTTEMKHSVTWDKINQSSDNVLDTIGNINVGINILV